MEYIMLLVLGIYITILGVFNIKENKKLIYSYLMKII